MQARDRAGVFRLPKIAQTTYCTTILCGCAVDVCLLSLPAESAQAFPGKPCTEWWTITDVYLDLIKMTRVIIAPVHAILHVGGVYC